MNLEFRPDTERDGIFRFPGKWFRECIFWGECSRKVSRFGEVIW